MIPSLTEVVIINISVKPRQFRVTLLKVKRRVLLLLGEPDCYEVHRKPRTKCGNLRESGSTLLFSIFDSL